MKKYLITMLMLNIITVLAAQDKPAAVKPEQPGTLENISINIEKFRNTDQSLKLRLRNIDYTFEKIIFYDEENIDIVFDITGFAKNPDLVSSLIDAHEGVLYIVRCTIAGKAQDGLVAGTLRSFQPAFLEKLP